jgi:hypothetical protein
VPVEAKLAKGGVEEHVPVGEVRIGEFQHDESVGTDVDHLDGVDGGAGHLTGSICHRAGERRRGGLWGRTWVELHCCKSVWIEQRIITAGLRYHGGRENEPTNIDCIVLHV